MIILPGETVVPCKGTIVTLVHGTWGRETEFIQANSVLRKYLRQHLSGQVGFLRFKWSGWNTHTARRNAGRELAAFLRTSFSKYPDYSHVLICHSHGGNVALYALRDLGFDARCWRQLCCVCIGTPFMEVGFDALTEGLYEGLQALRKLYSPQPDNDWMFSHWVTYAGLLALTFGIAELTGDLSVWMWLFPISVIVFWALFLGVASAADRAAEVSSTLRKYEIQFPLLCLFMKHDEAIGTLRLTGGILRGLQGVLFGVRTVLLTLGAILLGVGMIGGFLTGLVSTVWTDARDAAVTLFEVMAAGSACLILLLAYECSHNIASHVLGSHSLGFGWDGWRDGWFARYSVVSHPAGAAVQCKAWALKDLAKEPGLQGPLVIQHSLLYRSPSALDAMVAFIRKHTGPFSG